MESAFPIRPKPEDDPRFTFGLVADIRDVLKDHGYAVNNMTGKDMVELQMALYGFLYGDR